MISPITDQVYIGGRDDLRYHALRDLKITAILNVARTLNIDVGLLRHGPVFEYQKVGLTDDENNDASLMRAAADVLYDLTLRHDRVLCCCHEGKSRSASIVATYLVTHLRLSPVTALNSVQRNRHIPNQFWGPRPELLKTVFPDLTVDPHKGLQ